MNKVFEMNYYFCVGEHEVLSTNYIVCETIEEAQAWADDYYKEFFYDDDIEPDEDGAYWDSSQEWCIKPEDVCEVDGIYAWSIDWKTVKVTFDDKSK
jgi:hypothetical protein